MLDTGIPTMARPADRRRTWKWLVGAACTLLLLAWIGLGFVMLRTPERDYSTTRLSEQSLYQVTIHPDHDPIRINEMHSWTVNVETRSGTVVENETIMVDGDMPQHGHGRPSRPEVTRYLGNGDYLVEGMKFQMTGWWVMDFDLMVDDQSDRVSFNLLLK